MVVVIVMSVRLVNARFARMERRRDRVLEKVTMVLEFQIEVEK
jgi:hypothetical protein